MGVVSDSVDQTSGGNVRSETDRILSVPRVEYDADRERMSRQLRKEESNRTLYQEQADALAALADAEGLLAGLGVGYGKSLIAFLAPYAIGIDHSEALILHPARTREALRNELTEQRQHFPIPQIKKKSYDWLSNKGRPHLWNINPGLIIADECHHLRRKQSARTRRILHFFEDHPTTVFCAMSGSLTKDSIQDYAHLARLALRNLAPIPHSYTEREKWSAVLDVEDSETIPRRSDWRSFQPMVDVFGDGEDLLELPYDQRREAARQAFQKRMDTTPGVVSTRGSSVQSTALRIKALLSEDIGVPSEIKQAIEKAQTYYMLPNGQFLDTAPEAARAARTLSIGFFYRWKWEESEADRDWLEARREWGRQRRKWVRNGPRDVDTPGRVAEAIESGRLDDPDLVDAYYRWSYYSDIDQPPKEAVWVDEGMLVELENLARRLFSKRGNVLVWYRWKATAEKLSIPTIYPDDSIDIENQSGSMYAVSQKSCGTGKNLQQFDTNLVVSPPPSNMKWEQMLGRTHRRGQTSDEVICETAAHTTVFRNDLRSAHEDAKYVEDSRKSAQKIHYADWENRLWKS